MYEDWENISNVGHTLKTKDVVYMGLSDGEYLRKIRHSLGLTQQQMAEKIGYSGQKDISRIETGASNMSTQVRKLLELIEKHEL